MIIRKIVFLVRRFWLAVMRLLFGPAVFVRKGPNCRISRSARFAGDIENIELGANVVIADHVYIRCIKKGASVRIGDNVAIDSYSRLDTGSRGAIDIGSGSSINPFSIIYGHGGVRIGANVRIAAQTLIVSHNHIFSRADIPIKDQGIAVAPVSVGNDVWLGAGCKITAGTTIGNGCVVGTGAVVTRDLPPMSIAVGVPACVRGRRGGEAEADAAGQRKDRQ